MKPKFVYPGQYKKSCLINTCWVLKLEYNVIIYAYKFSFILSELYIKVHFFIHDWKHWQLPIACAFMQQTMTLMSHSCIYVSKNWPMPLAVKWSGFIYRLLVVHCPKILLFMSSDGGGP